MTKKKTPEQKAVEQEYRAERRKVLRRVRYARNKGYSLPEDFVPKIPKTITEASIRNIKKYTSEYIYSHAVFISPEGTKKKGLVARKEQRQESAKRGVETRKRHYEALKRIEKEVSLISQDEVQEYIASQEPVSIKERTLTTLTYLLEDLDYRGNNWSEKLIPYKDKDASIMRNAINDAISTLGIDAVLETLAKNMSTINDIVNRVIFGSGDKYHTDSRDLIISQDVGRFIEILTQKPLTASQSKYYTELGESVQPFIVPQ